MTLRLKTEFKNLKSVVPVFYYPTSIKGNNNSKRLNQILTLLIIINLLSKDKLSSRMEDVQNL
jgi:hypothetical protein